MRSPYFLSIALAAWAAFAQETENETIERDGMTVTFVSCPHCERRMRFAPDGCSATINLARIEVSDKPKLAERAFHLMTQATDAMKGGEKRPLMGWSSWNTFRVHISEDLILSTAQAMATNGLKAAGYRYVNIDDGFFGGRDEQGKLKFHPQRFPNGLKGTVDGIHQLGFKAGIYSEAGSNTCGSRYDGDKYGIGAGLYGHDDEDCRLFFNELGFDFIKVDFCGGFWDLKLDPEVRYKEIARAIRATGRKDVRFNVCRWNYPGAWISDVADSWRTTRDIFANWGELKNNILENLYLAPYMSLGHYNDMDMLQGGRYKGEMKNVLVSGDKGFTRDEELTHFGMWCMMSSPLLIGCDARTIPDSTKALVTNPYLLMMNQNDLGVQGEVAQRENDAIVVVKDADRIDGTARYVAMFNGGEKPHTFRVKVCDLELGGEVQLMDLVERADLGVAAETLIVTIEPHASRFFRLDAEKRLERSVYEAEAAYLSSYQEIRNAADEKNPTAHPVRSGLASNGAFVGWLGQRADNDLIWRHVRIVTGGSRKLTIAYASPNARSFDLEIDGVKIATFKVEATNGNYKTVSTETELTSGVNTIRLVNASGWMPDIDYLRIQ